MQLALRFVSAGAGSLRRASYWSNSDWVFHSQGKAGRDLSHRTATKRGCNDTRGGEQLCERYRIGHRRSEWSGR
jgi:hypothetical protein